MGCIDITVPIQNGMAHHPDDPPVAIEPLMRLEQGDAANVSRLCLTTHTGTHFDAPYHMIADGKKADAYPPDFFCGRARVIAFCSGSVIERAHLETQGIAQGDIVLLKTTGSDRMRDTAYFFDHACVSAAAAEYLAGKRIKALGFDYLSIEHGPYYEAHRILLGAGIPIIEGLCLKQARPGVFRITAMFLPVHEGDGAPLSAMLYDDE